MGVIYKDGILYGDRTQIVELTKTQYDALTPAQKSDITKMYFITDYDPSGEGVIDDTTTSLSRTWSSSKISSEITGGADTSIIAEDFDITKSYAVGDYVIYDGDLYIFISAHAAGAWNSAHVSATDVGDELEDRPAVVELTQAQYDALTEAQKLDTTKIYYVTDQDLPTTYAQLDDSTTAADKVWSSQKVNTQKADNSVIAPVENGATASRAYAIGEHFIRNGAFCTAKTAIASGATLTQGTNYNVGNIANETDSSMVPTYINVGQGTTKTCNYKNARGVFIILGRDQSYGLIYFVDCQYNRITKLLSVGALDSAITVSLNQTNQTITIVNEHTTYAQGLILFTKA